MGDGDDTFVWNPGDDNDTLEGQAGFDTMLFNGANVAENIDIWRTAPRVLFTRDIANVMMDLNDVESIDFNARGGADTIERARSQRHRRGGSQHQPRREPRRQRGRRRGRQVIVNGTSGDDVILILGDAGRRLGPRPGGAVNIAGTEARSTSWRCGRATATMSSMPRAWQPTRSSWCSTAATATMSSSVATVTTC